MKTVKRPASGLPSIPSSAGGIARLACARLRDAQIALAPIVSAAGLAIGDIEDRNRRIDARAQIRLLELAAGELQDDCFGFRLAQGFELGEIGLLYYVMASSEHLRDALQIGERYCAINNEGVRLRTSLEQGFAIQFEYVNIDRSSDRHQVEFWLITLVRICRALTGGRLAPTHIKLKHDRRETPPDVRSQLGCEIDFAADRDEVLFPAQIGALPVVGADLHLNKMLLHYADEALSNRASRRTSVQSRVEDQIAQLLPHGKANAGDVARRLGMSRRTLARALSSEGLSFSAVLEQLELRMRAVTSRMSSCRSRRSRGCWATARSAPSHMPSSAGPARRQGPIAARTALGDGWHKTSNSWHRQARPDGSSSARRVPCVQASCPNSRLAATTSTSRLSAR